MKKKLVIISGPTSVGKTELSIEYAKKFNGEIISADSVQVYKYLDIGSAKIMPEEMQGIKHHLIDILEPSEDFGADKFVKLASNAIEEIYSNNHLPIIVGGTAFYIQALLKGVDFSEEEEHNDDFRNELNRLSIDEEGKKQLHLRLMAIDKEYALSTPYQNVKRVIRALEYNHYTGKLYSEYNALQAMKESVYDYKYYVITDDREKLYGRINARVDYMIEKGLVDEVKKLKSMGLSSEYKSMNSIGYKEIMSYLEGDCTLDEAIENIKRNTRHFAKRQLTWFRREPNVTWLDRSKGNISIDMMQ